MKHRTGWSPEQADTELPGELVGETAARYDPDASPDEQTPPSAAELIRTLFTSGRDYAETEMERQRLRVSIAASAMRYAAMVGGAALFLTLGILVALPIGAIWVLAPHVGPLAATAIVFVAGLLLVALLLMLVRAKIRKVFRRIGLSGRERRS